MGTHKKNYRYILSHAALFLFPPAGIWMLHFRNREMWPVVYLICLLCAAFYGIILLEEWPELASRTGMTE